MRKRLICGLLLGCALVALIVGGIGVVFDRPIDLEHFQEIKEGMSEQEVIDILGNPSKKGMNERLPKSNFIARHQWGSGQAANWHWWGEDGDVEIGVGFDDQGKATSGSCVQYVPLRETWPASVWSWFRRLRP